MLTAVPLERFVTKPVRTKGRFESTVPPKHPSPVWYHFGCSRGRPEFGRRKTIFGDCWRRRYSGQGRCRARSDAYVADFSSRSHENAEAWFKLRSTQEACGQATVSWWLANQVLWYEHLAAQADQKTTGGKWWWGSEWSESLIVVFLTFCTFLANWWHCFWL